MDVIKTTAEYYRRGLLLGLDLIAETMAWLGRMLITEATPDIALIEASLCGSQGFIAVADWLAQVPGEVDRPTVARRLLGGMLTKIDQDTAQIPKVNFWLYQMVLEDDWPDLADEERMQILWDAYDLAVDGVYGDREEIQKELRAFLLRASLSVEKASSLESPL